jgi:hypothetical protein
MSRKDDAVTRRTLPAFAKVKSATRLTGTDKLLKPPETRKKTRRRLDNASMVWFWWLGAARTEKLQVAIAAQRQLQTPQKEL